MWSVVVNNGKESHAIYDIINQLLYNVHDPLIFIVIAIGFLIILGLADYIRQEKRKEKIFKATMEETVSDLLFMMETKNIKEEQKKIIMKFIDKARNDTAALLICKSIRYHLKYSSKKLFNNIINYYNSLYN
ncbi:MAG: hypothetical protein QW255_05440 [Candidatus Bilamarchaeaceae archaeon]